MWEFLKDCYATYVRPLFFGPESSVNKVRTSIGIATGIMVAPFFGMWSIATVAGLALLSILGAKACEKQFGETAKSVTDSVARTGLVLLGMALLCWMGMPVFIVLAMGIGMFVASYPGDEESEVPATA